ncbi:MAG: class I SAM-dependent methyltransferase [Chitinophagales bacterium]|nr:class I SAM-dependent methyltransferase [Chitinophagales bacterium]
MNTDLVTYYKERAREYERIYAKPDRQGDLQRATVILQTLFAGKTVLEIACGTGYWTERICKNAKSVLATDINKTMIDIAQQKALLNTEVAFGIADIFSFKASHEYDSLFGGFIWSHIPLQTLDKFLDIVSHFVQPGGTIVFMDNNFVAGSNHPVTGTDENGNSFQTRKLENGTTHFVLKNFATETFLRRKLSGIATNIQFINLKYFWILSYTSILKES